MSMTTRLHRRSIVTALASFLFITASTGVAYATHAWGTYHWARTSNPFTLKLGDNVSSTWDAFLSETSTDWTQSVVLDTTIVTGSTSPRNCKPKSGRVEVCNATYGRTGWLGVATIWITGGTHITQGTAKLNDTYFNTSTYNTPPWRRLVMCQEVAHTFGLAHQDENFSNPNLGSCMDYTGDPDGPPSNEHPNAHDYEQLELIYAHLDSSTTVGAATLPGGNGRHAGQDDDDGGPPQWGRETHRSGDGRISRFEDDRGGGHKILRFVIWAEPGGRGRH